MTEDKIIELQSGFNTAFVNSACDCRDGEA